MLHPGREWIAELAKLLFLCAGTVLCAVSLVLSLAGCASVSQETVEVKVPVAVRAAPPAELTAPLAAPVPAFVLPTDPAATSALTATGERDLQQLLLELLTRLRAWAAWANPER